MESLKEFREKREVDLKDLRFVLLVIKETASKITFKNDTFKLLKAHSHLLCKILHQ
jgi:hypothetical protein